MAIRFFCQTSHPGIKQMVEDYYLKLTLVLLRSRWVAGPELLVSVWSCSCKISEVTLKIVVKGGSRSMCICCIIGGEGGGFLTCAKPQCFVILTYK